MDWKTLEAGVYYFRYLLYGLAYEKALSSGKFWKVIFWGLRQSPFYYDHGFTVKETLNRYFALSN